MKKLFNTNVDIDFLQSFLAMKSQFDPEESDMDLDIWRSLYRFYKLKTNIHLFGNIHSLNKIVYELNSPLITEIIDRCAEGVPDVKISPFTKGNTSETLKSCNFVFEDIDTNADACKKHGIPHFITQGVLQQWEKFYSISTIKIPARKDNYTGGWKSLGLPQQNCNSMIICDNYLFQKKYNIDNTLEPMLDIFLPPSDLEIPFDLTIFTTLTKQSSDKTKRFEPIPIVEIDKLYDQLLERFRISFNLENINLTIVHKELRDYHDRHIFTNNYVFKSGNSFTYFGENSQSTLPSPTTLDIIPLTADNKDELFVNTYRSFLEDLKKIMQKSKLCAGSKQNRLFR